MILHAGQAASSQLCVICDVMNYDIVVKTRIDVTLGLSLLARLLVMCFSFFIAFIIQFPAHSELNCAICERRIATFICIRNPTFIPLQHSTGMALVALGGCSAQRLLHECSGEYFRIL